MESDHIFDAIIVGAGSAGLNTAYFLAKIYPNILIIDQGEVGKQTTWAAAGMLAPVHELDFQEEALLQLGLDSLSLYHTEIFPNLPDIGLNQTGTLEVALTRDDVPHLERLYHFQRQKGLSVTWLNGRELQEKEPLIHPDIPAGVFAPNDIQIDQRKLVLRLAEHLREQGCLLAENERIVGFEALSAEQICVQSEKRAYLCRRLILTAGFSPNQPLAMPFPLYPVKGQMLSVEPTQPPLRHTLRIRSRRYGGAYIVPKVERIVLGSTQEEMGTDLRLTAGGVMEILQKCYSVLPALYEQPILETWSGLRPATHARQPVFYRQPNAPVYYLNGLYRHGILLGPLLGQAMACWANTQTLPQQFEPFLLK